MGFGESSPYLGTWTLRAIWGIPKIRGPNVDPKIVGLHYKDYQKGGPLIFGTPHIVSVLIIRALRFWGPLLLEPPI